MPPFPGERIRTAVIPQAFQLTDQAGRACSLEDLRGRVVLVTGIYAMCATSCPEILIETRKLIAVAAATRKRPGTRARQVAAEVGVTPILCTDFHPQEQRCA